MRSQIQVLMCNTLVVVTSVIVVGTVSMVGTETAAQRSLPHYFVVTANNCAADLGSWAKVSGLDVSWDLAEYRSGDSSNSFLRHLRDSFDTGTVTLSRSASSESELVRDWLNQLAPSRESVIVNITLIDGVGEPVASWELQGVLPLNWTISGFGFNGSNVATETLVLAHEGFIVERSGLGC
jgi:phage tail-like protein